MCVLVRTEVQVKTGKKIQSVQHDYLNKRDSKKNHTLFTFIEIKRCRIMYLLTMVL